MAAPEERLEQSYRLGQKLWWLILGRLAAALVLLLASTVWTRYTRQHFWAEVFPPLSVVFCLTIIYSLAHRFSQALLFQARLQFGLDILLVTWLVWTSDVITSPYTALYIVIISSASVFLGRRDVVVISVGCAVALPVVRWRQ